jgi:hypothetical protein
LLLIKGVDVSIYKKNVVKFVHYAYMYMMYDDVSYFVCMLWLI